MDSDTRSFRSDCEIENPSRVVVTVAVAKERVCYEDELPRIASKHPAEMQSRRL